MADGLTSWMDAVALANTGSVLFWYVKGAYMSFELLILLIMHVTTTNDGPTAFSNDNSSTHHPGWLTSADNPQHYTNAEQEQDNTMGFTVLDTRICWEMIPSVYLCLIFVLNTFTCTF